MDYSCLDPYEQELLKVFNNYDFESCGSLDRDGLNQLCCTLQLEEQGKELVQRLLHDPQHSRITFVEFKEALLALLGNLQNHRTLDETAAPKTESDSEKGSPDREVSPKFVFGSKKYGRRSRPRTNDEHNEIDEQNENMNYTNKLNYTNNSVQRSSSHNDVIHTKKRKQNAKVKRCTSFPGNHDYQKHQNGDSEENAPPSSANALRKTWEKLGVGDDGYLNQTELVLVCDAIGLHRLAKGVIKQLSTRLEMGANHRISFQELLDVLQQDDTWSEVLNPTPAVDAVNSLAVCDSTFSHRDSKMVQSITLGPEGTGFICVDVVVDMWETVGIAAPKLLLQELGFTINQISVSELAAALSREIKNLGEVNTTPQAVLLQAILTLYKSEIGCLKSILEQMHAEREKLKNDVTEANNRATMLAQEVDDNHARMEYNTQNRVKHLEQKHADVVKQVTEQFANEKDQLSQLHQGLEEKIDQLEAEQSRLQSELVAVQQYSNAIEKENHALSGQVSELQQVQEVLAEQVRTLENEKQNYECENDQIEPLLMKLSELQVENSQLRDRTDEMLTEIESLNNALAARPKQGTAATPTYATCDQSMDEMVAGSFAEAVGTGAKRRSDESPSKDFNHAFGMGAGSPRLGKLRKCQKYTDEIQLTSSESGIGVDLDTLDSSSSASGNENEEIVKLQARVTYLEQILKEHSVPIPPSTVCTAWDTDINVQIKQLRGRFLELKSLLESVKNDINQVLTEDKQQCNCNLEYVIRVINQKLENLIFDKEQAKVMVDAIVETNNSEVDLKQLIEKYQVENKELTTKCGDLSNCIELLRNEYEKCEDYWAAKLDEERQIFEQEQHQNSETLNELVSKITEYESQFAENTEVDYRLAPIEEKYNLEKQFTDLEQEYEEYKEHVEFQIAEKDNEIADLREKLCLLVVKTTSDVAVQTDIDNNQVSIADKLKPLTNCVVETTNLLSVNTMPFSWSTEEQNMLDSEKATNSNALWSNPMNIPWQTSATQTAQPFSLINLPSTSDTPSMANDSTAAPMRPKRSRKHDKTNYKMPRLNKRDKEKEARDPHANNNTKWKHDHEQMVTLPLVVVHNINAQLHHLEQRCRHLQFVLKQQHYRAEQIIQNCWQQHRNEKAELQYRLKNNQDQLEQQMRANGEQSERLTRSDLIVKELYVENAYLIANVQRLENQCRILSQYNNVSSSV